MAITEKKSLPSGKNSLPLIRLFPNIVTIIGLCFGLFALKYAISQQWEIAVTFIVIAAFIDGMDGRLARILNASSHLGAQLDSLADFFNFSVAPAMILYLWKSSEIKGIGWAMTLFFIMCGALRLARFNVMEAEEEKNSITEKFFLGIPAPAAAGLSLVPMMIEFFMAKHFSTILFSINPAIVIVYVAVIGILMVSTIPTISIKKTSIRRDFVPLLLAGMGLIVISMIIEPWVILPIMGAGYLLSLPLGIFLAYRFKRDIP